MTNVPEWWPSYESAEMNAAWWHGYNFACRSEGIIGSIELGAIGEANQQAYLNGQRDMLAKCIAMVDDLASDDWYWPRRRLMGHLLALQEKP